MTSKRKKAGQYALFHTAKITHFPKNLAISESEKKLLKFYKTPGHSLYLATPERLHQYFKGKISLAKIRKILTYESANVLFKNKRQRFPRNTYVTRDLRYQVQADLFDVNSITKITDGIKYLLILIDIFSRRLWVYPLKSKNGGECARSMDDFFSKFSRKPPFNHLVTDLGGEFFCKEMSKVVKKHGVNHYFPKTSGKAHFAERVIGTFGKMLFRGLHIEARKKGFDFKNFLSLVVRTYNNRPHRGLKNRLFTPMEAELPQNVEILKKHEKKRLEQENLDVIKRKIKPKFSVGDTVKIRKTPLNFFAKGRDAQFSEENFIVSKVIKFRRHFMYNVKSTSAEDEGELIGSFYAEELTPYNAAL